MLFAIDDKDNIIEVDVETARMGADRDYKFKGVTPATEDDMLKHYKKTMFINQSNHRLKADDCDGDVLTAKMQGVNQVGNPQVRTTPSMTSRYINVKAQMQSSPPQPPTYGMYIVPKMFNYFPFMDCDDEATFEDCKFHLTLDDIPYVAYKSNPQTDSYWIFCDRQLPLYEAIDFIEQYPCDHRYAWIARHKKELCVRALPKYGAIPTFNEDHLVNSFTDDFKYWIAQFNDYWINGKVSKYIELVDTANAI
jgi:hypothetical protein